MLFSNASNYLSLSMAEKKTKKERPDNYQEKLKVKGSFLDIIKASTNAANKNNGKKKAS